ncbi:uncharacterized protein Pyn_10154 [Prunus yedoensis var. nudiflora]|uniref:cAMP-regulated phosphoprotein 19-related protein n=1 Tax=Prunus yedoensis var. nudiflora TaxID=2094558 RepID=A0A314YTZ4_PRUYE|nr:uncharacterized protein Pyn_10154 [Prunus yedoensis var. nudiflora]
MADCNRGEDYFSAQDHEASTVVQKYGGLAPKKKPLISKDHERAFFDSADWALCKQGAGVNPKSTAAVETLRPKLQRTPQPSSSLQGDLLVHLIMIYSPRSIQIHWGLKLVCCVQRIHVHDKVII